MKSARHFYITTLPALGELGSSPPMGLADLIEHVEENRPWREQLEALLLLDDLLQREALLAGETDEVEPAVLSLQQAQGEAPLPEALDPAEPPPTRRRPWQSDLLWERYFRYVHQLARSRGSRFLAAVGRVRGRPAQRPGRGPGEAPGARGVRLPGRRRPGPLRRGPLPGAQRVGSGPHAAGRAPRGDPGTLVVARPARRLVLVLGRRIARLRRPRDAAGTVAPHRGEGRSQELEGAEV